MPTFDGTESRIHFDRFGEGPDLVWVSGGGSPGSDWHHYQMPYFRDVGMRSTTFDNRGIGQTSCDVPIPWPIDAFARDTAELIEGICEPPVALVGWSLGAAIVQQVCIDRSDLVRVAVVMGTGAWSTGWGWDYQEAEIEFRKAGGRLDGMMGVTHYASMLYPARVLGDRELWPTIRRHLEAWVESGDNETSLIPQWETSLRFDQREALESLRVPLHVLVFEEDVEAPPQDGEELARIVPGATLHRFAGMGHGSWLGHAHEVLNPYIADLVRP